MAKSSTRRKEIVRRQYWHWHGLLVNVYQLPFNRLTAYIDPDKPNWFGAWSNDGAECLRALARTSRHALARECLVEFVRCAISAEGDLSWFLHGTGDGCLGRAGDSARLSEGVPVIVTAMWEYVAHTGDDTILDAPAGVGVTVWEKIRRYMTVVFEKRDINGDGLIEWINLWEGGADDKVGCFFSSASLEAWIEAVVRMPDAELKAFYAEHGRPVVNLYEQSFFLNALEALEQLALRRGEKKPPVSRVSGSPQLAAFWRNDIGTKRTASITTGTCAPVASLVPKTKTRFIWRIPPATGTAQAPF